MDYHCLPTKANATCDTGLSTSSVLGMKYRKLRA